MIWGVESEEEYGHGSGGGGRSAGEGVGGRGTDMREDGLGSVNTSRHDLVTAMAHSNDSKKDEKKKKKKKTQKGPPQPPPVPRSPPPPILRPAKPVPAGSCKIHVWNLGDSLAPTLGMPRCNISEIWQFDRLGHGIAGMEMTVHSEAPHAQGYWLAKAVRESDYYEERLDRADLVVLDTYVLLFDFSIV